jgi:hypothetical protein
VQQIARPAAVGRGGWPRSRQGRAFGHDDTHTSFLTLLAEALAVPPADLRIEPTLVDATPRRHEPESDARIFHSRLMPGGWDARQAGAAYDPGTLFNLVG